MRVLSVAASSVSIAAGLLALYLYISMRVKVFRHHLILLLLLFDFGKAVVLLWYPSRVLNVPSAYDNVNFCDIVGFLTSAFIEAADFAVLSLAIHTALLVFTSNSGPEGGLYPYRNWVYSAHVLVPLGMASLVFINNGRRSFAPMVTWCYIPVKPLWSHILLSWAPRYIIIVSILAIYLAIYIYVKLEYRKVVKDFKSTQTAHHSVTSPAVASQADSADPELTGHDYTAYILDTSDMEIQPHPWLDNSNAASSKKEMSSVIGSSAHAHPTTHSSTNTRINQSKIKLKLKRWNKMICRSLLTFISYFPGFGFLMPRRYDDSEDDEVDMDPTMIAVRAFQRESMANFQLRRNAIERQIRSIFVYPVAYIFLWMAPFAVHVLQYKTMTNHGGVFWIGAIAAFMQPFNCVVDTVAFCIREKPWIDRKEVIFTRENAARVFPCFFKDKYYDQDSDMELAKEMYYGEEMNRANTIRNKNQNRTGFSDPNVFGGTQNTAHVPGHQHTKSSNKNTLHQTVLSYMDKKSILDYDHDDTATTSTATHMIKHYSGTASNIQQPEAEIAKARQTSLGSDLSNSTDVTYPHGNQPQVPTFRPLAPPIIFPTRDHPHNHHCTLPSTSPRSSGERRRPRSSSPHFKSFLHIGNRRGALPGDPSPLSRPTVIPSDTPFMTTTARRVDLDKGKSNGDDDESEGEMDILEFLR